MSYLTFREESVPGRKTVQVHVANAWSGSYLGVIRYYPHWRRFVFQPSPAEGLVFDANCLTELSSELTRRQEEYKKEV